MFLVSVILIFGLIVLVLVLVLVLISVVLALVLIVLVLILVVFVLVVLILVIHSILLENYCTDVRHYFIPYQKKYSFFVDIRDFV